MNKKLIAFSAAVVFVVGCGSKTIVVEKVTDTTAAEAPPSTARVIANPQTAFLDGMTTTHPADVAMLGKTKIVQLGKLVCGSIDEGATLEDFALLAMRNNVDAGFIGALIREAVHNFCPENQWFIDSALNGA